MWVIDHDADGQGACLHVHHVTQHGHTAGQARWTKILAGDGGGSTRMDGRQIFFVHRGIHPHRGQIADDEDLIAAVDDLARRNAARDHDAVCHGANRHQFKAVQVLLCDGARLNLQQIGKMLTLADQACLREADWMLYSFA